MEIATCHANANIAIIKYWGNRDDNLLLPFNNSLAFTMDDQLQTKTTVMFDDEFKMDELWINDEKATTKETLRASKFLNHLRNKAKTDLKAKIFSTNSFPKGAGLASSASAFAALTGAAFKALKLNLDKKEMSSYARFGSGSATRSLYGGLVEWEKGSKEDGSDCHAIQIDSKERFENLRNVIGIVEKGEKKVGSREGMSYTTQTCKSYPQRLQEVPNRLSKLKDALKNDDFETAAPIIMEDSDSMHKVMRETTPSLQYLHNTSFRIIEKVKKLNSEAGKYLGAYTFDAGPNAHIYTTKENSDKMISLLKEIEEVKEIMVCKVGDGIKFSESHLM